MERLIEQKSAFNLYFNENDCDVENLINYEYKLMSNLTMLLEPLELETKELSDDKYSTLSLVIPVLTQLHVELAELTFSDQFMRDIKAKLIKSLQTRFSEIESGQYYRNSKLLDPRVILVFF
jgi:hypothetical protein